MSALAPANASIASLPMLVDRASAALSNARSAAEVLEAREIADFVARQVQNDLASGALSLGSLADIGKIGSDIVSGFEDIFG